MPLYCRNQERPSRQSTVLLDVVKQKTYEAEDDKMLEACYSSLQQ